MIRIIMADDHAIVRSGLKQIFAQVNDFEVVGEAANGFELLALLRQVAFDILLLDFDMPGISGPELIIRVKAHRPSLPILVLSMHDEPYVAVRAIKNGASGYITKDCDLNILLPAIRQVAAGQTFIAPGMAEKMLFDETSNSERARHQLLSERELQVLHLLIIGLGVNEIATQLAISNKTVSTHKVRLMEKLHITSMADLIRYAIQHRIGGPVFSQTEPEGTRTAGEIQL